MARLKITFALFILVFSVMNGANAFSSNNTEGLRIVINVPSRQLWLYDGQNKIKSYWVGVGRPQFPTPQGHYEVFEKVPNPGWEHPYKANGEMQIEPGAKSPLGTRWLGFAKYKGGEYGIHGTDVPSSVGKFSSHGCVRMHIPDAEDLYRRIEIGTPVEVSYDPIVLSRQQQHIILRVYPDPFHKTAITSGQIIQHIQTQFPQAAIYQNAFDKVFTHPADGKPIVIAKQ